MDYEKIYGKTLEEYCEFQGITIPTLVQKIQKDIDMLIDNLQTYAERNETLSDEELYTCMEIRAMIDKKKKHLESILKRINRR